MMAAIVRDATAQELADWDAHAVESPGGNVYQSRLWGEHRRRDGWRPHFLVFADGFRLLALERSWPLVRGSGAYVPRGPGWAGGSVVTTADRLRAAAEYLVARGVDVVAGDAEIPAETGYPQRLAERRFRPVEEVQPSRHRLAIGLAGRDAASVFGAVVRRQREMVRQAERAGLRVRRYDARAAEPGDGFEAAPADALVEGGSTAVFARFYDLMAATAERRRFHLARRARFVEWASRALRSGLALHLEVLAPDGRILGGGLFYRYGGRLAWSLSADRAELRREFPGVVHLVLWRALDIALSEGLSELDLGGVDVRGARRRPRDGEATYGLLRFKESFGGQWIELSGNHQWVARPFRYFAGRAAARLLGWPSSAPSGAEDGR